MIIDEDGSKEVPYNWRIWATSTRFQAIRVDAKPESKNAWGELRKNRRQAVEDANRLYKLGRGLKK